MTVFTVSGIALQIWSSQPQRAGRQYALQLPVILLYSLAAALFLFSVFPNSMAEGQTRGFRIGGAAGFAAFFMVASFTWLSRTRPWDELAGQIKKLLRENAALRRRMSAGRDSGGSPRVLSKCTRYELPLGGDRRHRIGMVTGNLANILGTDVWVNPENTRMEMSRVDEPTVSATIRYHGGVRDSAGQLTHDAIGLELAKQMTDRTHVAAAQVLVTGPGELEETHQVRRIVHVAAVEGEPGSGFRQVMDLERCVRNVLTEVDRVSADSSPLRSVVLPLLGTGGGNSDLEATVTRLLSATVDYFHSHKGSRIRVVYLLAYTDVQAALCRDALDREAGLTGD
ncbi:macro domain-containing protein [Streptomyces sp. NPDC020766]|uniref:macro domain-containing protein n=1 Tax=Streptomyces sp. NPDC020766 TaxID=3155011 RepID=UPI0033E61B90